MKAGSGKQPPSKSPRGKPATKAPPKQSPPPPAKKPQPEVRLNAATILREEARLQREEQLRKAKVETAMIQMRDETEFMKWQAQSKARDALERQEQMQMRKFEMEQAREQAIKATQLSKMQREVKAARLKVEKEGLAQALEYEQYIDLEDKKQQALEAYEDRANVQLEVEKVKLTKKQITQLQKQEREEALKLKKEQDRIERERREEIIQQIRDLESQTINRFKPFDPNEVVNRGLLEEMSYAQLQERLELRKQQLATQLETLKEQNLRKKEEREYVVMEKAEKIQEYRKIQAQANEQLRTTKIEEAKRRKIEEESARERNLVIVHEKLSAKHQKQGSEQARLEQELLELKKKREFLNANKAKVQEKALRDLQLGRGRKERQEFFQELMDQQVDSPQHTKQKGSPTKGANNSAKGPANNSAKGPANNSAKGPANNSAKGSVQNARAVINGYQKSVADAKADPRKGSPARSKK